MTDFPGQLENTLTILKSFQKPIASGEADLSQYILNEEIKRALSNLRPYVDQETSQKIDNILEIFPSSNKIMKFTAFLIGLIAALFMLHMVIRSFIKIISYYKNKRRQKVAENLDQTPTSKAEKKNDIRGGALDQANKVDGIDELIMDYPQLFQVKQLYTLEEEAQRMVDLLIEQQQQKEHPNEKNPAILPAPIQSFSTTGSKNYY